MPSLFIANQVVLFFFIIKIHALAIMCFQNLTINTNYYLHSFKGLNFIL